jgi:uncharacterized protein
VIPGRLVAIIAGGEGLMAVVAIVWAGAAGLPLEPGPLLPGALIGVAAALALAALNWLLLQQSRLWPGRSLRRVCHVIVRPLFQRTRMWHIVVVSVTAGVGEELLFRGVLQPLVGVAGASVLFGAVHVGGRDFLGYGAWAACIGALMGWLAMATGGLTAAIVAHALYDALALAYVRFGPMERYDE